MEPYTFEIEIGDRYCIVLEVECSEADGTSGVVSEKVATVLQDHLSTLTGQVVMDGIRIVGSMIRH